MRNFVRHLRPAAALTLLACAFGLSAPRLRAQTFDTVLNTNLFQPTGIAISPDNHYLISDTANHRIVDFRADNRAFNVLAGPDQGTPEPGAVDGTGVDARFRNPQGILCVGNLTYVADSGNHAIRVIDANGVVKTVAGDISVAHEVDDYGGLPSNWGFVDGPAATAKFNAPSGLAYDDQGHLYIADSGNHAIRMLDLANNTVTTVVRSGLTTPVGLALGQNGLIFIADSGAHSIKGWKPGAPKAFLIAGGGSSLARGFRNSAIATNALFSAPAGIFYREVTDELIVADSGNGLLRTIQGASGAAPVVSTFANTGSAGFQTPIAITRDLYGVFLVCDSTRNALMSVITVRFPRITPPQIGYIIVVINQTTGIPEARLVPVTDQTFDNLVKIAISGDATAQHHYTSTSSLLETNLPALPTTNDATVVNFASPLSPAPSDDILTSLSLNSTLPPKFNFRLRAFTAPKGVDERIPSLTTDAIFRFKCGTPQLDSQSTPGRLVLRCSTTNAVIYYTMDGSEPIKGIGSTAYLRSGDSIPLILTTNTVVVKARAYMDTGFIQSDVARAEFSPDNFVPNRISLGFADGEASTLLKAAPGQRYFAPVTLSLMPNAQAYGLQFDVSLTPKSGPASADYQLSFDSTLVERFPETNRVIPPSMFVLAGTNLVTNFVTTIATNFTYQVAITNYSALPTTNYVAFTNKLADVVPVITTLTVSNLGQVFQVPTTNYATNSFQFVRDNSTTNTTTEIDTNYLYRYVSPSVTNLVHVDAQLPDSAPVVVTNFVSNLGQLFSFNTTNYITNSFNLVSSGTVTNVTVSVDTNYAYQAVSPAVTNFVSLNGYVPADAEVIVTNFVTNLGQLFPVTTTNRLTNGFDLVSALPVTNFTTTVQTNYAYRSISPGTTTLLTLNDLLPDRTPVVVTNFLTNLGQLFPVVTTNYISNAFNLQTVTVTTNNTRATLTNYLYEAGAGGQTNTLVLDHVLAESTEVITTNFVPNLGDLFPVLSTNRITNSFNLVSASYRTNLDLQITSNFLYAVTTPTRTNLVELDHLLNDQVAIVTTNFVSNLGQQFPVLTTNYISNSFNLFGYDVLTNTQATVATVYDYRAITPGQTNFFYLTQFLPDSTPVISTNFVTNLGQLFPIATTNYISNAFNLVSAVVKTNSTRTLETNYLYQAATPAQTNTVVLDHLLADHTVIITTNFVQNMGENFPVLSTNAISNAFNFISASIVTNVVVQPSSNYLYAVTTPGHTNTVVVDHYVPDTAAILTTNFVSNVGELFPVVTTNVVSNTFNLLSVDVASNRSVTVLTNYAYMSTIPGTTNLISLNTLLPDSIPVIVTNFLNNLGQQFPVTATNYITNAFDLVSADFSTNVVSNVSTSFLYRSITPGVSNYLTLDHFFPDTGPVVTLTTKTNLGNFYTMSSTNIATNVFELVSADFTTNTVNRASYEYSYAEFLWTNMVLLPAPLSDGSSITTTNTFIVTNDIPGGAVSKFNVVTTHSVDPSDLVTLILDGSDVRYLYSVPSDIPPGTFISSTPISFPPAVALQASGTSSDAGAFAQDFFYIVGNPILSTNTNVVGFVNITTNALYRIVAPAITNYIALSTNLPDVAPVVSTVILTNQGQNFTFSVTNYATNVFELVSTTFATNVQTVINTNAVYAFRNPSITYLLNLTNKLPDFAPVVTTTFVTNLGQLFPIAITNYVANTFDFLGESYATNTQTTVRTNITYVFTDPPVTNYVLWPELLPDVAPVLTTNLISNLGRQFPVIQTNYVTNAFRLVSSGFVTNTIQTVVTNVVYEFRVPGTTSLVLWPELLPDSAPVLTTNFISNLGRQFPVVVTNYVQNTFQLLQTLVTAHQDDSVVTNVTYGFSTPNVTNYLSLPSKLPDSAPVITTTFLTNLGQLFPITSTNYVFNTFDYLGQRTVTNNQQTVVTNVSYLFVEQGTTNFLSLSELLPPTAAVLTTNLVVNLGRQFPVIQTNYVTNSFLLVSSNFTANLVTTVQTNVVYEIRTGGSTNLVVSDELLPDQVPVVTTNFISNLGRLFPVAVTNYLTNTFRLVDVSITTNDTPTVVTNATYAFVVPGVTNYLNLSQLLPDSLAIVTTNFISNLGQLYPVLATNIAQNTFELLSTNVSTNVTWTVSTNVLYALKVPSFTNVVIWPVKLPDFVSVISTNFITNLGQLFPVLSTNIVANRFQFLYTNYYSNTVATVANNIWYEFHSAAVTNFFTLDLKLPDSVQVITTNFVTNLGQLFPVRTTNITANVFDLISTNLNTNLIVDVSPSYLYAVISPGSGSNAPVSISTNFVTIDHSLQDVVPIITVIGFVTNLTETFPVFATNYTTNTFRLVGTSFLTNTVQVSRTNVPSVFADLVVTNNTENWLAVGWIERFGQTNLYNTHVQTLISFSQPHNTLFRSVDGEAVAGAFSFIVPTNAATGNQYTMRVSRPSATADGVSQDMFIQAPEEDDPKSPVKAVRTLTVTNLVGYIVGDVSDFRWFNAGEFGDGNILNNDLTDLQQAIVYGLNLPPLDSDYRDAMDTCCYTVDGRDLSNMSYASDPTVNLNDIAFGEGSRYAPLGTRPYSKLEVNDLFLAFRRSLDPSLAWYQRYWSNGTRQARIVANTFRAQSLQLQRQSTASSTSVPSGPSIASDQAPALTVYAGTASGLPGKTVAVPIHARVQGGFPLRTLMFNAHVETADGMLVSAFSLEATAADALGAPTVLLNDDPALSGAVWLDTSVAGVLGDQVVARVLFTIPADATPTTIYNVKLDRVSGSPNGVSLFPVRSGNGLVAMANRPTPVWNDGIPDAWRLKYFGTLNDLRSAADVDADGDGLSNYEEYKLGTNPLDPNDSLRIQAVQNGRGVKLRFHTASGKLYKVEASSDLQPGTWLPVLSNVAGTGNDVELPDPGGAHSFYYRVRLQE